MCRYLFVFLWIALIAISSKVYGSHAMGTDITYECVGPNQYRITLSFYRDCSGIPAPASMIVNYFAPSCGISQGSYSVSLASQTTIEVSPLCPAQINQSRCNGGTLPGVQQVIYSGIITLPAQCSEWVVSYAECCRNTANNIQNAQSYDLFAYATINNTGGLCDNSPVFTTLPVPFVCANVPFYYNHGAVDIDGDSLVYELIQPLGSYTNPVPYAGTYGVNNPLSTTAAGAFAFDSLTGQMSFTPDIQQVAVITIRVLAYRNGVLVGSTMRDIQVVVLPTNLCANQPPDISPITNISGGGFINGSTIQMCPNSPLTFDVTVTDAGGDNVNMSSNATSAIPGSTFSVMGSGATVTGRFTWVPTVADTGFHPFQITYSDDGCPVSTPQTVTFVIYVFDRVEAGGDQVFCGLPLQLNAIGGSFFNWTPIAGLSNPNINNPLASPSVSTMYYVTSDCGVDSVFVDVQPPYTLNAGNDTSICLNSLVQLNPTVSHPSYGPFIYLWSPGTGLSGIQIANPIASPPATTTYTLTAISAQGCIRRDTITINIAGVAPNVTASADPVTVCPGGFTQLNLSTSPTSCGISAFPCNTPPEIFTAGTGTLMTGTGTPYEGFWHDGRVQYLYRASELNALGISGGTLTQIAFNIGDKASSQPYNNFTIKVGCTNLNVITGFVTTGMSTVFGPASYLTTSGWNTHTFTNPYDWDGTSNLLVEVCFDNNSFTQDDDVYYTNTSFQSVAYTFTDGAVGCNLTSSTISSNRPNTRFSVCKQTVNNAIITWNPSTGLNNPASPNPVAQVFGTTTFIASVNQGGCEGQGFVTVNVDTTVRVEAFGDTSLCQQIPVQLSANAIGTPSPIQLACGINGTPVSTPMIYSVAGGTGVTANPTPFSGNFHDGRMQILFRKAELNATGMERGIITNLAFEVAFKNTNLPFNGFTIKMGCTALDVLDNSFAPNLDIVFNPKSVSTVVGWNTFNFDNPYDWDGFSNLIFEICFDNNNFILDDIISFTPTAYRSVNHASADWTAGCILTTPTGSSNRPNVRLSVSPPPPGVFTYSWSPATGLSDLNSQFPISNATTTTTYVVTVTDGICIAADSVTINYYTGYNVNLFGSNVGCDGAADGNIVSLPNGGVAPYDFEWSTGKIVNDVLSDTIYNLPPGVYSVTLTDNNGCNADGSITLTVPPPLSISIAQTDVSCAGEADGTALVTGTGGTIPYNYLWSNTDTSQQVTQLIAGNYQVILTDASGCSITDGITIIEPAVITAVIDVTNVSCFKYTDGSATAIPGGGTSPFTFSWSDNDNQTQASANNLPAGNYSVTITDSRNCFITEQAIITEPDSFGIIVSTIDVSCFNGTDGSASASVMGDIVNYIFTWNTAPPRIGATTSGLPAGQIVLSVADTSGCIINSTLTIGEPSQIVLSSSATDALCFGASDGTATVTIISGGTAPFQYEWSNLMPGNSITGLSAAVYDVTVEDVNGCIEVDTVEVNEPAALAIVSTSLDVSCNGLNDGSAQVDVTGGTPSYSYQWNLPGVSGNAVSALQSGDYSVTITDQNNCVDSTSFTIIEPSAIVITNVEITRPCAGASTGVITLTASGGTPVYYYSINGTDAASSPLFTGLEEGTYRIELTDDRGCDADTTVSLIAFDTVSVSFNPESVQINLGQETQLDPIISPANQVYSFSWEPATGLSCTDCPNPIASPVITTPYELTVFDENNCPFSEKVIVEVANDLIVLVPNAFSPNGDGVNDFLYVYGVSIASVNFRIFNRWGEKVFETNNPGEGWDGTYRGKKLASDVYVYYVEAIFEDGQEKQIKGSVTIYK